MVTTIIFGLALFCTFMFSIVIVDIMKVKERDVWQRWVLLIATIAISIAWTIVFDLLNKH